MHVHLALPGLLWPARALPDVMFDLDLPALSWLLGRGRPARSKPLAFEHWLADRFGHGAQSPPAAALRLLGEGDAPGATHWIAADPMHLAFEHGHPTLGDPTELCLQAAEIAEIAVSLAPTFAEVGDFSLRASGHGYIALDAPAGFATTPVSAAIGRGAAALLPRGADAARWLRLANEAQMALHDLELNRRREAAGKPTVNTLWFWGAGSLPTALSPAKSVIYTKVGGGDTLARGCARHAGVAWQPAGDAAPDGNAALLIEDRLIAPTQQLDAEAWREALLAIERERLAPLAAALRGGRIKRLTLTALGDEGIIDLELVRGDALRFWCKPRSLVEMFQ
jgi:hypothetical protein